MLDLCHDHRTLGSIFRHQRGKEVRASQVFVNYVAPLLAKWNLTIDENLVSFADCLSKLRRQSLVWFDMLIADEGLCHQLCRDGVTLTRLVKLCFIFPNEELETAKGGAAVQEYRHTVVEGPEFLVLLIFQFTQLRLHRR